MKKGIGFFGKLRNWRFVVSLVPLLFILFFVVIQQLIVKLIEGNRFFSEWLLDKVYYFKASPKWIKRWLKWIAENDTKQPTIKAQTNNEEEK